MIFMPKRSFLRLGVPCPKSAEIETKSGYGSFKKSSHKQLCALNFFQTLKQFSGTLLLILLLCCGIEVAHYVHYETLQISKFDQR